VLLVDDHRIILDGLRALLWSESDINVVAQAQDGRTAVRLAGELSPDLARAIRSAFVHSPYPG
jgi:YesN/AraC family two-component response regulator